MRSLPDGCVQATTISTSAGADERSAAPARRAAPPARSTRTASATPMPRARATKSRPLQVGAFQPGAGGEAEGRRELLQRRVAPVVEDDEGHRQLQLHRAPQRLDRVHRRAVADQRDHARRGPRQGDADGRRQAEAEAAAGHRVEGSALQHRQVAVHHRARARRLFDDDVIGIAHLGQGLQRIGDRHRHRRLGPRPRRRDPAGTGRSRGAGRCSSVLHRVAQVAHGGGADRRPGGGLGVVGDLAERGAGRHVRAVAFDVVGEGGRAEHQHQVAAGERATIRSRIAGRKPANCGWSSAKPQRADIGAVKTRAR